MNKPSHKVIAEDFAREYKGRLMYSRGLWHSYEGGLWCPVNPIESSRLVWEFVGGYEDRGINTTKYICRSVEEHMRNLLYVREEMLDSKEHLINLRNGVYNLKTWKLREHRATDYCTSQLPFDYDPESVCPTWERFVRTTFTKPGGGEFDAELADFVQEAMGYSLTLDNRHQVMFWALGSGSNGKGVLFNVLEALAGESSSMVLDLNNLKRERYNLANLGGKKIAFCSEANATANVVEDALIKQISGGDKMSVRQNYGQPFELRPRAKIWWAMNAFPVVADVSDGFWRRVRLIPFNSKFTNGTKDLDLTAKLMNELSGIFNWVLVGLRRLNSNGRFTDSNQVTTSTEKYRYEANILNMFMEDHCVVGEGATYQSSIIYAVYKEWSIENGHKPFSNRTFKREMEAMGYYAVRTCAGVLFQGVGPKDSNEWGLS